MLRLSGASPISNSLCNRHRNNGDCLATGNWRRGAGRGPEWCAPLLPAYPRTAHALLQPGGAGEGAPGAGLGRGRGGGRLRRGLGVQTRSVTRVGEGAPGRGGRAVGKEAGRRYVGRKLGEGARDGGGNRAGTRRGWRSISPGSCRRPCARCRRPSLRPSATLPGRSHLGGGHEEPQKHLLCFPFCQVPSTFEKTGDL